MPRENKKRGRRGEKRKHEGDAESSSVHKRQKSAEAEEDVEITLDDKPTNFSTAYQDPGFVGDSEPVFFGSLDDEEQEIFKRAHALLDLPVGSGPDAFPDDEAKNLFLENLIWKEADGKELKLACSQSCSKLLEEVMFLASPAQLKRLFVKFRGKFSYLLQHRFASHCCETLFLKATSVVNEESESIAPRNQSNAAEEGPSMEQLFVDVAEELTPNLGFLMTDVFGSHVLRALLIVFSGRPLSSYFSSTSTKGNKKAKPGGHQQDDSHRAVPASFHEALEQFTSAMIASLDSTSLHILVTHPVGNPMLQLLIDIELTALGRMAIKSPNSLYGRLLPDDPSQEDSQSRKSINHLLYDTVGSRLLEVIFQKAPEKLFKHLYKAAIQSRLKSIIRNDAANFVLLRCVERMGKKELKAALCDLCPLMELLIERNRASLLKVLIERCREKEVDISPLIAPLQDCSSFFPGLFAPESSTQGNALAKQDLLAGATTNFAKVSRSHWAALFVSILSYADALQGLIGGSILALDDSVLVHICQDTVSSRVIQAALTSCHNNVRKPLVQKLIPRVYHLAPDVAGSHVVEALLPATENLRFLRLKIGEELLVHQKEIGETQPGRIVCMNWNIRAFQAGVGPWAKKPDQVKSKSGIEIARAKFAEKKRSESQKGAARGVNASLGRPGVKA